MAQSTPDSKLRDADLKAGDAVAAGALVAGPLLKRSDWLHSWNKRFAILTPEELAWQREPGAEWRSVTLLSEVRTFVRDNGLTLIVQPADASSAQLCFRAASEPELLMWHSQIRSLLEALQAEGRVAFLHMRESSAYFSRPYEEIPHIGSRNHRERALTKLYYTCQKRTLVGQPQQPIEGSEVCMYLMALPALSSSWSGQQRRAFRELLDAITAANHPFLLGVLRADILPDVLRAAVYRPLLARGSLKDVIHRVASPREPYATKYRALGRVGEEHGPSVLPGSPQCEAGTPRRSPRRPSSPSTSLPLPRVALYGRQVLEAISFLHSIGLPCAHVHSGNVLISPRGNCLLTEFELAILGAEPFHVRLARPEPPPGVLSFDLHPDVLGFGHMLYEMLTATVLSQPLLDQWQRSARFAAGPRSPSSDPWPLLERIFVPAAGAQPVPTIAELLVEPFFAQVACQPPNVGPCAFCELSGIGVHALGGLPSIGACASGWAS